MKKEVVTFSGGINNLIAPHLISENTAPYVANANIVSGELVSAREPTEDFNTTIIGSRAFYYKAKDELVTSKEDRFYVEWAGFLYWSNLVGDGSGKIQRYDGTDIVDLGGHTPPTTAPTVAENGSGLLYGEYSYCYTFVYDEVFETAPSEISTPLSVINKAIELSGFPTSGVTPEPTAIIIYRSGGLNPTFNKVNEIPYGQTTYKDNTSDFNISRKELNTGTNDAPPADIDMLVESKGTLFGAVGDKVHFSKEGQPEFWSDYNYVQLPTVVTGLAVLGDAVIAFTEDEMFGITGRNIQDVQMSKLPHKYGCKHKRTVQNLKGRVLWLTKMDEYDLICSFSGGEVEILNYSNMGVLSATIGAFTYNYFTNETYDDFTFNEISAIAVGRKYLLFLTGRTVVIDFEFGTKSYYMVEEVESAYEMHNTLFVIKADDKTLPEINRTYKAYEYLKSFSHMRDFKYITKDYSDGSLTQEKEYRKIHVNGSGEWGISVTIDGSTKFSFTNKEGSTIFLPSGLHGKLISFSISSRGYAKIKAIMYEYDPIEYGYKTMKKAPIHKDHCEISVGGAKGTAYHLIFKWNPNCMIFKKGQ